MATLPSFGRSAQQGQRAIAALLAVRSPRSPRCRVSLASDCFVTDSNSAKILLGTYISKFTNPKSTLLTESTRK